MTSTCTRGLMLKFSPLGLRRVGAKWRSAQAITTWPLPCMSMPARHAADLEADCTAVPASTHQRSTSSTGTASPSTSATSACRRTRNQRHHRPANRNDRERTSSSADDHLRAATTTPMCGDQQEVRCSLRASVGDDSFQSKAAMLTARWRRAFKQ